MIILCHSALTHNTHPLHLSLVQPVLCITYLPTLRPIKFLCQMSNFSVTPFAVVALVLEAMSATDLDNDQICRKKLKNKPINT